MTAPTQMAVPPGMCTITTHGSILGVTTQAWMDMRSHSEKQGLINVRWQIVNGTLVEKARNDAVREMLRIGAQWLLFLDGDMHPPPDSLIRLLTHAYQPNSPVDVIGGYCVSASTRILHRHGYGKIGDLVGQAIEVFNGVGWSRVVPFQTGVGRRLVRVLFSDGSSLDCTPEHVFSVKTHRKNTKFRKTAARDLRKGMTLPSFQVPNSIAGSSVPEAYTLGAFLGDGGHYVRNDTQRLVRQTTLYTGKHHLPVEGSRGKEHSNGGIRVTLPSAIPDDVAVSLKQDSLPEWVFQMDRASTLAFLAGWFDTDGTSSGVSGGGYELSGTASRIRDAQLLMRRAGFSYTHIRPLGRSGYQTNYGVRGKDLMGLRILGREAALLPCHRLKSTFSDGKHYNLRQVQVVSVESLDGEYDTFCFSESEREMGVFGNVLTHQCTLKGDWSLPTIDTGTGTWESWFPGSGVVEVIRTGAAFLLIKRHVFERLPDPWFRMRVPMRPLDALLEVDNYARIKLNGINPFKESAEWKQLEALAMADPSLREFVPAEVGEDSAFSDRVKAAGMRMFVDTDCVIGHMEMTTRTAWDHKQALEKARTEHRQLCGLLR